TGGSTAAAIWQRFMADAHRGRAVVEIPGTLRAARGGVGVDMTATGAIPAVPQAMAPAVADPIADRLRTLDPLPQAGI
ncbi:hypothetical protein J8J40_34600, partial [Mycobacterium tuberculosis]|nr:hypothetical protein [Mycobacterium tuberculosis]